MGFIFKDSEQTIIRAINEAFIKKFSKDFGSTQNIQLVENAIRQLVRQSIVNTKTWKSLINGGSKGLDAHFGIPKDQLEIKLGTLLEIWSNEIVVKPEPVKRRPRTFVFAYRFYAIQADWANVLSSSAGVTINESRNAKKGITPSRLPWLEWLLISGDQLKIDGYHIDYGNYARSRSGKAFMRPKLSWRIPTGYGPFNKDNNFITRALEELAQNSKFRNKMNDVFSAIVSKTNTGFDNTYEGL